jgi:hypothetical protein
VNAPRTDGGEQSVAHDEFQFDACYFDHVA